ncbi:hypothetical protein N431DRAFT_430817 [Stipitochalara longipes BDJ]|nr:hypothetical protein N431DRAFT_430817 [Stipitochalara longipes BDJ]
MNHGVVGGKNSCHGSLQSNGSGLRQTIYGLPFFNAYYAVFNAKGLKFRYAPSTANKSQN